MTRQATISDAPAIAMLATKLWPHHSVEDMTSEFEEIIQNHNSAFFLCFHGESTIGFAQCQLRHDYVEGTKSSPVGYWNVSWQQNNVKASKG